MTVKQLLQGIDYQILQGNHDTLIHSMAIDSRLVTKGSCFIAIRGTQVDGHRYIGNAIQNGASVIICEKWDGQTPGTIVQVSDTSDIAGLAAHQFYGQPSSHIKLVGITGTNGKSSTVHYLYQALKTLGTAVGMISTIANYINEKEIPSTHTTPDPVALNHLLADMVEAGCEVVVMEVSSHAIHQKRIRGLEFDIALFTNISHDHLDYHGTFEEYIRVKKQLFDGLLPTSIAISNVDDKRGKVMLQNTKAKAVTFSLNKVADYKAKLIDLSLSGMQLRISSFDLFSPLTGKFNAYNLVAAFAVLDQLGYYSSDEILRALSMVQPARGRFQRVQFDQSPMAIIDYAHSPDALKNIMQTILEIKKKTQQFICIVGCGGDRDKKKRPVMAQIAVAYCDTPIFTSDNPRTEDPNLIIDDMMEGLTSGEKRRVLVIPDRAMAIKTAMTIANSDDVVLIAGKGHETYQEIDGKKFPFNDASVVREALAGGKNM